MGRFGLLGLGLILALFIAVPMVVSLGNIWLAQRTVSEQAGKDYNSSLSPFLTVVGLVYGALLGFTIVVVSEESLATFPEEFREGMAARAGILGDTGRNTSRRSA